MNRYEIRGRWAIRWGMLSFGSLLDSEPVGRGLLLFIADSSSLYDHSPIEFLRVSVVVFSSVDELGHRKEVLVLDGDDFLVHEPLDSLAAGRSGQGALVVEDSPGSGQVDWEFLFESSGGVEIPRIEGIGELAEIFGLEKLSKDGERFILSLMDHMQFQIILLMVEEMF